MEIKEIEETKRVKKIILTEDEYHNLISENREYGSRKTKDYISFCVRYYTLRLNWRGIACLFEDIIDYIMGNRNYIPNLYNKTFSDWLNENK